MRGVFSPLHLTALLFAACVVILGEGCNGSSPGSAPPAITSVSVSCTAPSADAGQTDQCSANVQGTGAFSTSVAWSASAGTISPTGLFTASNAAGSVTITATSTQDSTKSGSVTLMVPPATKSGFLYRGITHTSFQPNEYNTGAGTTAQDALAATRATWAGVLVTQYQADATANTIASDPNRTPTDAAVVRAITELHNKNVRVMLKPHVDAEDGAWRGTFQPANPTAWFQGFQNFIVHYATLARDNNVEMLCFGTEYTKLSGTAFQADWTAVISAIRNAGYTGLLAYAANATFAGDEFTSVSFWDQVDVIGMDAYFPLTNKTDPTIPQLVAAWSSNKNGENVVADVQNFANAHPGKPVIFTEIGYRSVAGTNTAPYDFTLAGAVDPTEQENCYEAMYEVWSQQNALMKGNLWWSWSVPMPAVNDTDYTPWTKPAETVLRNWQ
jgi:glycosyl hydrolase family 113/Big-like domain-containing protein